MVFVLQMEVLKLVGVFVGTLTFPLPQKSDSVGAFFGLKMNTL